MGERGAGDRALEHHAVRRAAALLLAAASVSGCSAIGDIAGLATGGVAGGVTANPAIGFAVGVGTSAAVDEGLAWANRVRQRAEQDEIASVAGALEPGEVRPWRIRHDIPLDNERGDLRVVRVIATPLATCKEVLFTVVDGDGPRAGRARFTTTVCRDGARWKWASAEPAVDRWGYLQGR